MHGLIFRLDRSSRLDYQPLFGKMSPHSSLQERIKDRTRETAEIEPTARLDFQQITSIPFLAHFPYFRSNSYS